MKEKLKFYSEIAYVAGIVFLAFGTSLLQRADFGMSMIVAPAYILHLKVSQFLPWFSFGIAEYCVQAIILLLTFIAVRKFKPTMLFSFGTAIFYGLVLDLFVFLVGFIPFDGLLFRAICFVVGFNFCTSGVAFLFHTYIAPETYELFVKELSTTYHFDINKTKTAYDCASLVVSVILSFLFFGFGNFQGIYWGTLFTALFNGIFIGFYGKLFEKIFNFSDGLPLRKYFE